MSRIDAEFSFAFAMKINVMTEHRSHIGRDYGVRFIVYIEMNVVLDFDSIPALSKWNKKNPFIAFSFALIFYNHLIYSL